MRRKIRPSGASSLDIESYSNRNGDGTFTAHITLDGAGTSGAGVAIGDFTGDGAQDIIFNGPKGLLRNGVQTANVTVIFVDCTP